MRVNGYMTVNEGKRREKRSKIGTGVEMRLRKGWREGKKKGERSMRLNK